MRTTLALLGIQAKRLILEVTESVVIEDLDAASGTLGRLKELGVEISIDDFGTGFSSLAYLERFPIDSLKIDRCFVAKIGKHAESLEVLRAILTMAHNLGLEVIAEGVETEQQLTQLLAMGFGLAQGYLFSRPVGPKAACDLLTGPPAWKGLPPFRQPSGAIEKTN